MAAKKKAPRRKPAPAPDPAEAAPAANAGDPITGTEADVRYKTWACERLMARLTQEDDRRKSLESKAIYGTGIVLGLVGLVVQAGATVPRFSLSWLLFVLGTALMGSAVYATLHAVRVLTYPELSPRQLADPQVFACMVDARLEVLAERLVDLVEKTQALNNQKAQHVRVAQYCALAGALCYLIGVVGGKL